MHTFAVADKPTNIQNVIINQVGDYDLLQTENFKTFMAVVCILSTVLYS